MGGILKYSTYIPVVCTHNVTVTTKSCGKKNCALVCVSQDVKTIKGLITTSLSLTTFEGKSFLINKPSFFLGCVAFHYIKPASSICDRIRKKGLYPALSRNYRSLTIFKLSLLFPQPFMTSLVPKISFPKKKTAWQHCRRTYIMSSSFYVTIGNSPFWEQLLCNFQRTCACKNCRIYYSKGSRTSQKNLKTLAALSQRS